MRSGRCCSCGGIGRTADLSLSPSAARRSRDQGSRRWSSVSLASASQWRCQPRFCAAAANGSTSAGVKAHGSEPLRSSGDQLTRLGYFPQNVLGTRCHQNLQGQGNSSHQPGCFCISGEMRTVGQQKISRDLLSSSREENSGSATLQMKIRERARAVRQNGRGRARQAMTLAYPSLTQTPPHAAHCDHLRCRRRARA